MPDDGIAGIHIMAALATAIALAAVGALVLVRSDRRDWPLFALSLALELPVSWLLLEPVRQPLNAWVTGLPLDRTGQLLLASVIAPIDRATGQPVPMPRPPRAPCHRHGGFGQDKAGSSVDTSHRHDCGAAGTWTHHDAPGP